MSMENLPSEFVWDYQTIEEQIPELKERDIKNNRVKKITSKLAEVISGLGKMIRAEIKVTEGNRAHLLSLPKQQLEKMEPEILAEAFGVVAESLLHAIVGYKPSYQKLLQLNVERDVNEKRKEEAMQELANTKQLLQKNMSEFAREKSELLTTLFERDLKIKELEKEVEGLRLKAFKTERDAEQAKFGRHETSNSLSRPQSALLASKEFFELKKMVMEEKADLALLSNKKREINSLKLTTKKKDQLLVESRDGSPKIACTWGCTGYKSNRSNKKSAS